MNLFSTARLDALYVSRGISFLIVFQLFLLSLSKQPLTSFLLHDRSINNLAPSRVISTNYDTICRNLTKNKSSHNYPKPEGKAGNSIVLIYNLSLIRRNHRTIPGETQQPKASSYLLEIEKGHHDFTRPITIASSMTYSKLSSTLCSKWHKNSNSKRIRPNPLANLLLCVEKINKESQ